MGEICRGALESFRQLIADVYLPSFKEQATWGKCTEENVQEFLQGALKYGQTLTEAVNSLQGGVELRKPDKRYVDTIELKPQAFNKAAGDAETADHFEQVGGDPILSLLRKVIVPREVLSEGNTWEVRSESVVDSLDC
jgi:dynein heavy chain